MTGTATVDDGADDLPASTRAWVEEQLSPGTAVTGVRRLAGGWTSQMRLVSTTGAGGDAELVLRSFATPFFRRHAPGLLTREAEVLTLLASTTVPAARLLAVDAEGSQCADPSLLMTLLPGRLMLDGTGSDVRRRALAEQLVHIHDLAVPAADRPRSYQPWTSADRVQVPERTGRPDVWRHAVDVIRQDPPAYDGCFLHRDFHPGNVLFAGPSGAASSEQTASITGVVDWVETSWGPRDLDVAHCATAVALLHGPEAGGSFVSDYLDARGSLSEPADHLYWRMLDALAFAPDAGKVAGPWRELGRTDLTPQVVTDRLEGYLELSLDCAP